MRKTEKYKSCRIKEGVGARQLPRTTFMLLILVFFCLADATAQETITASGGEAPGSGGSVSYSVGQLFYNIHTGTNGLVAEGVQQPWEISVLTGIPEAEGIDLTLSAFPTPRLIFLS